MIPKYIHQIWIQGEDKLRPEDKNKIDAIKLLNPGYTHKVWAEKDIIPLLKEYPGLYEYYMNVDKLVIEININPLANKSDIARRVILYKHGGCYMDTDVTCVNSLDSIIAEMPIRQDMLGCPFFGMDFIPGMFFNQDQFIICTIGHPLLKETIIASMRAKTNKELGGVLNIMFKQRFDSGSNDICIIPENQVSCFHCGSARTCMIPYEIGSSTPYHLYLYSWWCDNKGLISVSIIIFLMIALWYVWKYKQCCVACNLK